MRVLLQKEVNIPSDPTIQPIYNNSTDQSVRCTPFSIAVANGHRAVVALLLDAGK